MSTIKTDVRACIEHLFQVKGQAESFEDHELLITSGRLQSMDVLEIALFLEERYGIDFSGGFDQSRLDSVLEISALVQERAKQPC